MDSVERLIVGVLTIAVNILVLTIGGTWKLSELKASLVKAISDAQDDVEVKQQTLSHEFGETVAALRQKVTDQELWNRDNFVRRDEFYKMMNQQNDAIVAARNEFYKVMTAHDEAIKAMGDKIEARLERMETKIDQKT